MGISIWQLLIILVIVMLLFGTKKLRNLGSDLGATLKSFRSAVGEGEADSKAKEEDAKLEEKSEGEVIDAESFQAAESEQKVKQEDKDKT